MDFTFSPIKAMHKRQQYAIITATSYTPDHARLIKSRNNTHIYMWRHFIYDHNNVISC